jgi:(E)-4-hydroxy-3-methylbut-2-enyl-diphosphate synthase
MDLYCNSLTHYSRYVTREVNIGGLLMGGNNPIRVQSMTTTDTLDTIATVAQAIRMIEAGCELVRITAPSMKEAQNLENIKNELRAKGYNTPLVADIHFTPNAAEIAARIVEKVRINPGNFADKKKFEHIEYTDSAYNEELDRIRERFTPLVKICKEYGTAMRVGTNHGSLSDRILSRYGDTPLGMVESAMEFLRICEDENYYNIVLSMKASNALVVVEAYRLLVATMQQNNMNYPLHLGVTEAGDGEDGRIKSAVGIGTLLEDGLGDTIRVSLTEDPEFEIPVAKALVERYAKRAAYQGPIAPIQENIKLPYNPFEHERRATNEAYNIGNHNVPRVVADFSTIEISSPAKLFSVGYNYSIPLDKWNLTDMACDYIYLGKQKLDFAIPGTLSIIQDADVWDSSVPNSYPLYDSVTSLSEAKESQIKFLKHNAARLSDELFDLLKNDPTIVVILKTNNENGLAEQRRFFIELGLRGIKNPVIIKRNYNTLTIDHLTLYSATDLGGLLVDGFGDGIWINVNSADEVSPKTLNQVGFGILQATRTRISKTEYISCPSCGRTLFDLQETTAKIRNRTSHLKGVKIGIMGCIVNGPGEMADADFGYVGTGVDKITLYRGKEVVKRNLHPNIAVDELIQLIKDHGMWVEEKAELDN